MIMPTIIPIIDDNAGRIRPFRSLSEMEFEGYHFDDLGRKLHRCFLIKYTPDGAIYRNHDAPSHYRYYYVHRTFSQAWRVDAPAN